MRAWAPVQLKMAWGPLLAALRLPKGLLPLMKAVAWLLGALRLLLAALSHLTLVPGGLQVALLCPALAQALAALLSLALPPLLLPALKVEASQLLLELPWV